MVRSCHRLAGQVWLRVALVVLAVPGVAGAQMGNPRPVVTSLTVSPQPVPSDASATIGCDATDDRGIKQLVVTVTGGTLAGGGAAVTIPYGPLPLVASEQVAWSTPAPGSYTVTCTVTDNGGTFGGAATATAELAVETVPQVNPPGIDSLTASAASVFRGEPVQLAAQAHGEGLSYTWTATGGSLATAGATATWTAPDAPGTHQITLTVTDALGRTDARTVQVQVVLAQSDAPWSLPDFYPSRIARDAAGNVFVSDPRAGEVVVFDPDGKPLRHLAIGGAPGAIAVSRGGELYVVDTEEGRVTVHDGSGALLRALGIGAHEFAGPLGIALHPITGRVFVVDSTAAVVRVFEPGGAPVGAIAFPDGRPVGIAFDPVGSRMYVTDASAGRVRAYDAGGALLGTMGTYGRSLVRPAGVAVGRDGLVYVVDSFNSRVAVFTPEGAVVGYIGEFGDLPGQLEVPLDVTYDARRNRLLVTNTQLGRVEQFSLGAAPPFCAGDSDCDGMPDLWELAHGTDPFLDDALADPDGDGLTNLDEYRHGTDPRSSDTDGDGVPDGVEVQSGLDPAKADRPEIVAAATKESDPGLVRISASLSSSIPCTPLWRRVSGLDVVLRGPTTLSPSFVARPAGEVVLEGVATCGAVQSLPARVTVTIRNAVPRPDPGRIVVVRAGTSALLDGSFTRDANGDDVRLEWTQTLGFPLASATAGALLELDLGRPGLFGFRLASDDGQGGTAEREVTLLAVPGASPVPTALAAETVVAQVGDRVRLDASASAAAGAGARFSWVQLDGPAATITGASAPVASFVPAWPGRYAFQASLAQGAMTSPPARVHVLVAAAGATPPTAAIAALEPAVVGQPVVLDGSPSSGGTGLAFLWRQVAGPAAGLTDADRAVATVVPFEAGSFLFELLVSDDAGVAAPARVRLDATDGGRALPLAVARGPEAARVRELVRLDGSGSTSPGGKALRYRWTQVAGPWVALDQPDTAAPSFRPPGAGTYRFELEVDDGTVRSAPAAVGIAVDAAGSR